ncbi:MAG: AAA family ATPase [Saprospiraceae bacterium]
MLPVKLTLQGINSYQKSQVIDFQNLIDNQIFGIFGEVGSGKSTIPEAISYALYGKTERLGRNDGISYNMMNLRSDTLLIDFEFKTQNESHYRFVVKGKRNSKNFEDVSFEKLKYEKVGIEWFPNEKLDAEELLGLNYDNFKRTIIIPQNKFMEFIQLGDSDRTKMLKEIFNLNKFDLYAKTRELEIESSQKLANLNGQLESLILFDVEQLKQKNLI